MTPIHRIAALVLFALLVLLSVQQATQAQTTLLSWDFAGFSGSELTATADPIDAGLGAGSGILSRGSGLTAADNADRFNATSWATTSIANAVSGNDYFEFSLNYNGFNVITIDSIFFQWQRSGTGPLELALRSSLDSYGANISTFNIVDNTSTQQFSLNLDAATFADLSESVTFRLYGWAESTGGSGGFEGSGADLVVSGSTAAPAPGGDDLYWTASGSTLGGTGTWATSGNNWSASDTSVVGAAWDSTKKAIFTNSPAEVTVATVTASAGIQFATDGYTLSSGTLTLDGASAAANTITTDAGVNATINSVLDGSDGLTKAGDGNLTLGGANTYTGGITVSGGRLIGTTGSLLGNIANNAAVTFNQNNDGSYTSVMSGSGSLVKDGTGTVTLSGANTYNGGTLVSAGRLVGTTTSLQGDITNNAAVTFEQNTDGTYGGVMSGSGSLTKAGTGTTTLTGANTYSGGTLVSAGRLVGTTTSLQGAITNNAAVTFDQNTNGTYGGVMSGSGSLAKAGTGTTTLSGSSSYEGGTTIEAGGILVDDDDALGSSLVTLSSGSLLATAGTSIANNIEVSAGVSAGGSFTFFTETFSNSDSFTMSAGALGTDGIADYLTLTDGSTPPINVTYTGFDGKFLAGQDIDDGGWPDSESPSTFQWSGIDISRGTSLSFAGLFGSAATATIDEADFLRLEYRIDGGGYATAILFRGPTGFNSRFYLNGDTNSATLSSNLAEFTQGLVGTGSTLDLRYTVAVDAGGEDFASDTFVVTGERASAVVLGSEIEDAAVTFEGGATLDGSPDLTAATGGNTIFSGSLSGDGGIRKTGAGTVTLSGASANNFIGMTTVRAGTLQLNKATDTDAIAGDLTIQSGATLLLSSSGNVADASEVTLSGGTIQRASGVSEVFGNLNLTTGSFLDFGSGTAGTIEFSGLDYTPSALLSLELVNFTQGNTLIIRNTSNWASEIDSGFTFSGNGGFGGSTFSDGTFTITAIPEPSTYAAAAGLIGLMLWPSRKRLLKDAKKILGITPPMRDRLAARREQRLKAEA